MVTINGVLTQQYGVYSATVIIHITGLLLSIVIIISRGEHPFVKGYSWLLYLGGAIGVATTAFTNFAFSRISVSSILALGLFGQSITGLIIDQYGWLDMPVNGFKKYKIFGLFLLLLGIISMTNNFDLLAVVFSFLSGVFIVVSRTLNAKLSGYTSVHTSTFYNYLIGLLVTIPVFFIFGRGETGFTNFVFSPKIYIYFGGMIGLGVVLLSNITVMKISAFYLSLFLFIGQVFSGILIDVIISREFSPRNMISGILVAAGLSVNLLLDRRGNASKGTE